MRRSGGCSSEGDNVSLFMKRYNMKKHSVIITCCILFSIAAVAQPLQVQQCIVVPGKGCGTIMLGASRQQMESLFGKNLENAAPNGISMLFDANGNVKHLGFHFSESPYIIGEQPSVFKGQLERSLNARSTLEQFIQVYGTPVSRKSEEFIGTSTTILYFNGMEVYFADNVLSHVYIKPAQMAAYPKAKPVEYDPESIKIDFDKLYSNIDILGTNSNTKTSNSNTAVPKLDCTYIMDFEKCRNILFTMSTKEVLEHFGKTEGRQYGMVTEYAYKGIKILVANTGIVESVEYNGFSAMDIKRKEPYKEFRPYEQINWGSDKGKVTKMMGKPESIQKLKSVDNEKVELLYYDDNHSSFEFVSGKLVRMEFKRKVSDQEYTKMRQNLRRQNDSLEALKTPAQRARDRQHEVSLAFTEVQDRIKAYINEINRIIGSYSTTNINLRSDQERAVAALSKEVFKLVDDFLKKYDGQLPSAVVDHLLNLKQKLSD